MALGHAPDDAGESRVCFRNLDARVFHRLGSSDLQAQGIWNDASTMPSILQEPLTEPLSTRGSRCVLAGGRTQRRTRFKRGPAKRPRPDAGNATAGVLALAPHRSASCRCEGVHTGRLSLVHSGALSNSRSRGLSDRVFPPFAVSLGGQSISVPTSRAAKGLQQVHPSTATRK